MHILSEKEIGGVFGCGECMQLLRIRYRERQARRLLALVSPFQ